MIVSIHADDTFGKIQYLFITKIVRKIGIPQNIVKL